MDEKLKQRLVGAAVLVSLLVIIAPMILDQPPEPMEDWRSAAVPPRPEHVFRTDFVPVSEAEITTMADPAALGSEQAVNSSAQRGAGSPPSASRGAKERASDGTVKPSTDRALGAWAVQLGSFSNSANALALRDRLRAKGFPAFIEDVRVDQRRVQRVYVGPELLRAKAAESLRQLQKETDLKGLVVRYPAG
ncbi:MAG: SPOR domain-containing protein [Gammaproteobacteria bacterium]|nr:SPOR domain-containing protein [Gammaproteobacteria bacterium]MDJ0870818.1 SPOR domain-containing protein [Gammaproteobacteria bacterium]MDJ0891036.1 SPOR domain-containing protein [Gammaproteobacteria bacterium]